jgi:DNA processing protein
MDYEELGHWLRLTTTPGVGPHTARQLLSQFGLPEAIFAQSETTLKMVVSANVARALKITAPAWEVLLNDTWAWLQATDNSHALTGHQPAKAIITLADPRYPAALLATEAPPVLLYCMGEMLQYAVPFPTLTQCIAVVGSRNPTAQGAENAQAFSHSLCNLGLTVISGLALGIDACAHQGALQSHADLSRVTHQATHQPSSTTIAVIGTGIDRVYPSRHIDLAHRIAAHGMIVSEYPLGTPPIASNFPKRNRIISGLSQGVLVVEAALASGSLITARMAIEQGRDVFAIPGSIHAPQSRGCHALIRQGAKLVESSQDILEEWPTTIHFGASVTKQPAIHTATEYPGKEQQQAASETENIVLQAIGFDPIGLDQLQARTGLDTPILQVTLLELELANRIARMPGGLFQQVKYS